MADLEITFASVSIPAGVTVTLSVYEDVGGDGSGSSSFTAPDGTSIPYDNSNSTTLTDGQTTYTLSGFDGSSGNNITPRLEPSTTDYESSKTIGEQMEITVSTTSQTANVTPQVSDGSPLIATAVTPGYIVWDSTTDWDSLQSEENIEHTTDIISLVSNENDGEFLSGEKTME